MAGKFDLISEDMETMEIDEADNDLLDSDDSSEDGDSDTDQDVDAEV